MITVYHYPWYCIRHLDGFAGGLWVVANIVVGLFLAYYLVDLTSLPIKGREAEPLT